MTDPTVDVPSCKECGSPVKRKKTGPLPTYCSARCRAKAGNRRAKADGRQEAQRLRRNEAAAAKREAIKPIPCIHCGTEFKPKTVRSKLCSPRCKSAHNRDNPARQCDHDGCIKPVRAKGLCVQHYHKTYYPDRSKRWPEDPANKAKRDLVRSKRRRAIVRGLESEDVDRAVVGERDRWVCGICHGKVDKALLYPHPMSQSLDHVIPLAEGGPHTYANTRITHLECNNLRRDRGGNEQLALIG